jgi:hypothetical protein
MSPVIKNSGNYYVLSFDYLGEPLDNTITESLGCSIGITALNPTTKIYASAIPYALESVVDNTISIVLTDDFSWHHYDIPFSFTGEKIKLNLQDQPLKNLIPTRAGDYYFKNIILTNDTIAEYIIATNADNQALYNTVTHKVVRKEQPRGLEKQVCVEPNRIYDPIIQKLVAINAISCKSTEKCSERDMDLDDINWISFGLGMLTGAIAMAVIAKGYQTISKHYNNQPAVSVPSGPSQQLPKLMVIKAFHAEEVLPVGTHTITSIQEDEAY